ncbi:MAG: hypothetical protein KKG53_08390 [Proteobacteria bacterium]|nr:hypothetical protein [Pseudomonadota bacterium]
MMKGVIFTIAVFFSFTCVGANAEMVNHDPHRKTAVTQKQQQCLDALDSYFVKTLSYRDFADYNMYQSELTMYRFFGTLIALRLEQKDLYDRGQRTESPHMRYTLLMKDYIALIEKDAGGDPQFIEAKRSFEKEPLTYKTLAQLAPFVNKAFMKLALYDDPMTKNFTLDNLDFAMLEILASYEKYLEYFGPDHDPTYPQQLDKIEVQDITPVDVTLNLPIINQRRIRPRKEETEKFWQDLTLPQECQELRREIGLAPTDNSLYPFMSTSGLEVEIFHTLYKSLHTVWWRKTPERPEKERQIVITLHRRLTDKHFYVGRKSPWGSIDYGTYRP